MRVRTVAKYVLVAVTLMSLASGCKDGGPSARIFVKNGQGHRLRVAVLPFDNVSKDQDAGRVITNTVITYLLSTGNFDVVEPGVVYSTIGSEGIRLTEGVTVETCSKLQPKLNADAFIVGLVEDYGEVRIGPDSYPSISFSARLVDAHTADILWAATISKTGADNVKLFDIGRVSSLGKLSKQAVAALATSLAKSRNEIAADMSNPPEWSMPGQIKKLKDKTQPGETVTDGATPSGAATTPVAVLAATAKYLDESTNNGEKELRALLKDVGNAKIGEITYKKHFHDTVETTYTIGEHGKSVEARLVDYRQREAAEKFVQLYNAGAQQIAFETLPAFESESTFGFCHLDLAIGRYGLFLRGPKANKADIEALGKGIIDLLK